MSEPLFTDSHCHLGMVAEADALLGAARSHGIRGFVVPGTKLDDAEPVVRLAERHADVWAAVGFHPHEAKDYDDAAEQVIRRLSESQRVVAIGEIGVDYFYNHSSREQQREAFLRQVRIAKEQDLPVIIHNRDSAADLLELLGSEEARGVRGVLHSFTDTYQTAAALLDAGFYISFSGIVTFKNAEPLRDVLRRLPMDRVLIETDTPFLAPVPHRGKENQPAFVTNIAQQLATVWQKPLEEVAAATTANFERIFNVDVQR